MMRARIETAAKQSGIEVEQMAKRAEQSALRPRWHNLIPRSGGKGSYAEQVQKIRFGVYRP